MLLKLGEIPGPMTLLKLGGFCEGGVQDPRGEEAVGKAHGGDQTEFTKGWRKGRSNWQR